MKLIKNYQPDINKGRVLLQHASEDAFGNHFDFCMTRNLGIKSHAIPHCLTHRLLN